ncbi:hypothetical protein BD626DRAFT_635176 [Schizophyllum amplum]|uniref:Uncharacterized protein n=1 Tax=Schizophyllum amplum TaxID=97359 RepID=A0A550BX56_9AGAR|nr:hypothetical protein BD626DRAFT_635176 [Auriculariopsis ampla]
MPNTFRPVLSFDADDDSRQTFGYLMTSQPSASDSLPQVATSTGSAVLVDALIFRQKTPSDAAPLRHATSILPTAASRVASIYEIILEICKIACELWRPDYVVAARLITVSRFISEIALDVLWERQTSLAPLFRTIPRVERRSVRLRRYFDGREIYDLDDIDPDLTTLETVPVLKIPCDHQRANDDSETSGVHDHEHGWDEDSGGQEAPDDGNSDYSSESERSDDDACEEEDCDPNQLELTDDEYETFNRYATRIRAFEHTKYGHWELDRLLIDRALMFAVLRRGPLLPRARVIRLSRRMLLPVHGDHLIDLEQPLADGHAALVVRRDVNSCHAGQLCPLARMREVTMAPDCHLELLSHLRNLPLLEKLHLIAVPRLRKSIGQCSLKTGFRTLRWLGISGTSRYEDARLILSQMSSQPLRLRVFIHQSCRKPTVSANHIPAYNLFRELRARLDPEYLEDLTVTTARCSHQESARPMFADLGAFPNVKEACVDLADSPIVDVDEVLDVLTHAWPALQRLYICNDPSPGTQYRHIRDPYLATRRYATLGGLSPLAQRCPRLRILSIPLRVDEDIPRPLERDSDHVLITRQVGIDVGKADVGAKAVEVAAFLASIFPSVQFICAWNAVAAVDERWKGVARLINQAGETPSKALE